MQTFRKREVFILLSAAAVVQILFSNYLLRAPYLDFFLIAVVYIGWHSSPLKASLCGILFGLTQDILLRIPMGFYGLSKTIVGFSASYLSNWVTLEGILSRVMLIGLFSLLDSAILYSMFHVLRQPSMHMLELDAVIKVPITAIGGEIFFRVYDRIKFPPKDFRHIEDQH